MSWRAVIGATLLAAAGLAPAVSAHETTRSYVSLEREGERVEARLRVAFRDIEVVAWMHEDLDGRITWGEVRRHLGAVDAYVRSAVSLEAGGACAPATTAAATTATPIAATYRRITRPGPRRRADRRARRRSPDRAVAASA